MANPFQLIPAHAAWVQPDGKPTPYFYRYMTQLFNSTGAGVGLPTFGGSNAWTGPNSWGGASNFGGAFKIAGLTITFPPSGVLAGLTDPETFTNKTISSGSNTLDVIQAGGSKTNDSAGAGNLGEFVSSTVLLGAAVGLTSTVSANVTSISLTAGDWDVWGVIDTTAAAGTTSSVTQGAIGTVSATLPTPPAGGYFLMPFVTPASVGMACPVGSVRLSLAVTTTVYLVVNVTFAVSTMGAYGFLGARRRR